MSVLMFKKEPRLNQIHVGMKVGVRCYQSAQHDYHVGVVKSVFGRPNVSGGIVVVVMLTDDDWCDAFPVDGQAYAWTQLYRPDARVLSRPKVAGASSRGSVDGSPSPASGSGRSVHPRLLSVRDEVEVGDVVDADGWPTPVVYGTSWAADEMVMECLQRGALVRRVYRRG